MMRNICGPFDFPMAAALLLLTANPKPLSAQTDEVRFVGEVIIVGNDRTSDGTIRRVVQLYPGQVLHMEDVRQAEQAIADLGLFVVDPEKGIRPTVSVLESPGEFKDVLVRVQEKPTEEIRWMQFKSITLWVVGSVVFLLVVWRYLKRWGRVST